MNAKVILFAAAVALVFPVAGCKKKNPEVKKDTVVKTTTAAPTGPVELKLKWPAGRRMVQRMSVKQDTEIAVPNVPAPVKQGMEMEQKFSLSVLSESPDGGHEVEMKFLSTRFGIKMGNNNIVDYDSAKKTAGDKPNPMAGLFDKIVGAKLRYQMDGGNKVVKIEGLDELQAGMKGDARNETAAFKEMFSEGFFKQMLDHSQNLPGKAVQPGDTWPVSMNIPLGEIGTMSMDFTYTLKGWEPHNERYCARIGIEGTVNITPAEKPGTNAMHFSIENGTSTGETWFDLDMGVFVDTTLSQDMKASMEVPVPTQPARRGRKVVTKMQKIAMTMKQEVTITVESVE